MDKTLREYLCDADRIHNNIIRANLRSSELEKLMVELRTGIKTMQAIAKKMADVSNVIQQVIDYSSHQYLRINPYPNSDSHAIIRYKYPDEEHTLNTHANSHKININAITVDNACDIPTSKLYYIKNLDQFAINVNGIIIKGNMGNIGDYGSARTAACEYGTHCKSFQSTHTCHYYHYPEDYIKKDIPIEKFHLAHRNFTVGSWITSNAKKTKHFMRHIGSLSSLASDLQCMQKRQYHDEVATREEQIMHDILIYMVLMRAGYVDRYRD